MTLLPSWNDTAPRKAIIAFVEKVTAEDSTDFVPRALDAAQGAADARLGHEGGSGQ
jgi:hypothetical protein